MRKRIIGGLRSINLKTLLWIGAKGETIILILILVMAATASISLADNQSQTDEKEKIFQIVQGLQLRKTYGPDGEVYWKRFLDDFKAKKGIEFVEPILQTDDYYDPKLQSFLRKCPKLGLNKNISFEPRIWEDVKDLPEEDQEKVGMVCIASYNFKLYQVDIDNDPKNGIEYVFYGGGYHLKDKQPLSSFGQYYVPDFERCRIRSGQDVRDSIDYLTREHTGNSTGIIKYRGKYYIYELWYLKEKSYYSLRIYGWRVNEGKLLFTCSFEKIKN